MVKSRDQTSSDTIGLLLPPDSIWRSISDIYKKIDEIEKRLDNITDELKRLEKEFCDHCTSDK